MFESKSHVSRAVPFAGDGPLKMLYDNRMHPQALEFEGQVYLVWRGDKGLPHIRTYDVAGRTFSEPSMVLEGFEDRLSLKRYARDHHFSPVIWIWTPITISTCSRAATATSPTTLRVATVSGPNAPETSRSGCGSIRRSMRG